MAGLAGTAALFCPPVRPCVGFLRTGRGTGGEKAEKRNLSQKKAM